MDIGYGRVSTLDQNPDLQRDALQTAGVEPRRIYLDTMSGALTKRPALDRAPRTAPPRRHPGGLAALPAGAIP